MGLTFKQSGQSFVVPPGINLKPRIDVSGVVGERIEVGGGAFEWNPVGGLREGEKVALEMVIDYSHEGGRYKAAKLALASVPGGPEITGALLRTVRVQEILRNAVQVSARIVDNSLNSDALVDYHPELFEEAWSGRSGGRRGPDERVLRSVALKYRLAEIQNDNPALIVSQSFLLNPRTATNWIKKARDGGYFEGS